MKTCVAAQGPSSRTSIGSVEDLRTGDRWFEPSDRPIFFPRIDDNRCDRIRSSLTAVHCFEDANVEKQPVAWKENCAEYRLRELQESMDRCNGRRDITEIT